MEIQRGGKREGAGRKPIGRSKTLSLTLSEDTWNQIEQEKKDKKLSQSAVIRSLIEKPNTNQTDSELLKSVDGELMRELKKKAEEDEVPVSVLVQYALMHVLNNPDPYTIYEVEEDCYTPPVPTYDDIYADELRRIDELNRPSDPNPFNRND